MQAASNPPGAAAPPMEKPPEPTIEWVTYCFGGLSVEEIEAEIRKMQQRGLQDMYDKVYPKQTKSNNNMYLRRKLLEAIGIVEPRQKQAPPKKTKAKRDSSHHHDDERHSHLRTPKAAKAQRPLPPCPEARTHKLEHGSGANGAAANTNTDSDQPNTACLNLLAAVAHQASLANVTEPTLSPDSNAASQINANHFSRPPAATVLPVMPTPMPNFSNLAMPTDPVYPHLPIDAIPSPLLFFQVAEQDEAALIRSATAKGFTQVVKIRDVYDGTEKIGAIFSGTHDRLTVWPRG